MKAITKKLLIKIVADRWRKQYPRGHRSGSDKNEIYRQLCKLPANATEEDIERIVGNSSWTENECDECGEDCNLVIIVGEELTYESSTAGICLVCLEKAISLAKATNISEAY